MGKQIDLNYVRGFTVDFNMVNGLSKTAISTKRYLSQMKGMYNDTESYDRIMAQGDKLIYEFYEMAAPETDEHIAMGTTITYPGKVGNEFYMTKGHFHTILNTAEVYYCLSGKGVMLMESPEGDVNVLPFEPGKALYVPPRYAHRSINTGSEPLVSFFAFRGDAGHDYGTIETKGFRKLVIDDNDKVSVVDNPRWK